MIVAHMRPEVGVRFVILLAEGTLEPDAYTVSVNRLHMLSRLLPLGKHHGAQFTRVDSPPFAVTALLEMTQHKVYHIWNHAALVFNQARLHCGLSRTWRASL